MKFSASAFATALALSVAAPSSGEAASSLAKDERAALLGAKTALDARNYAAAGPAIADAKARARSGDARYLAASFELQLGIQTNNSALQASAIETMLGSGVAAPSNLEELYKNQGSLALAAGKLDKAEDAFGNWVEIAPNNPAALLALAEVKDDRKKLSEAVALILRAISARQASGQAAPESWYKRGLKHAFDAKMPAESLALSRGLVAAYPTAQNWRDALLIYRELNAADPQAALDAMRLLRSARALGGERDYLEFAEALGQNGAGEAKAMLEEGVSAKMVDPSKARFKELLATSAKRASAERATLSAIRTKAMAASASGATALQAGDAYLGAGDYANAAELYRAAIAKGGIDANLVNSRLGIALALSGKKAEAGEAFRAVAGPRADLAGLWLVWIDRRA